MRSTRRITITYTDKTADWRSKWIQTLGFNYAEVHVNVTSLTGTLPTLDPKIEVTYPNVNERPATVDGSTYYETLDLTKQTVEVSAYTQYTGASIQKRTVTHLAAFMRVFFDLGGTVTDCDVILTIVLVA